MFRRFLTVGVLAAALLTPRAASAITVDQIVTLVKSGVTDVVILALIDRDRTVFAIAPEQIVSLQRDGISEQVLLAMLRERPRRRRAGRARRCRVQLGLDRRHAHERAGEHQRRPWARSPEHAAHRRLLLRSARAVFLRGALDRFLVPRQIESAFVLIIGRRPHADALLRADQHAARRQPNAVCHRLSGGHAAGTRAAVISRDEIPHSRADRAARLRPRLRPRRAESGCRKRRRRSTKSTRGLIKQNLQDPRITTELVDHLPASDTVPSPLKFLGRIVGDARRADLREGHPPLLRGARQGGADAREVLEDRQDRRRPRHRPARGRRRGHDREPRQVQATCSAS